jgi:retron-type reverse transcriptase
VAAGHAVWPQDARTAGSPTIRDRVAQMAAKPVIEPILEAD